MDCIRCGKPLSAYDVGFFKKLVNRGAAECACIACTAQHFELTEERAWEMGIDALYLHAEADCPDAVRHC